MIFSDESRSILDDGTQEWYKDGVLHRDGGKPAYIGADGTQIWYIDGKLHRDGDKPAYIGANGSRLWFKNGLKFRNGDKPAVILADGTQKWYKNRNCLNNNQIFEQLHLSLTRINARRVKLIYIMEKILPLDLGMGICLFI